MHKTLAHCLLLFLSFGSKAQPGTLDSTFGKCGVVFTGLIPSCARATAVQSDGKILAAGYSVQNSANSEFALARYNTDGSLDTAFGYLGKISSGRCDANDGWNAMTIQSDGKIVVAGSSNWDFALSRYNSDGNLDSTFGNNGTVLTDFGSNVSGNAVSIQADGKILVAGTIYNSFNYDFALARYHADGTPDNTFGIGGKIISDIWGSDDFAYSCSVQSDGKIVVSGYSLNGAYNDFALARYDSLGGLDSTFGVNGKVITDFGGFDDNSFSMAIQADGKIILAGYCYIDADSSLMVDSTDHFALARYLGDGNLDTAFGSGGKLISEIGNYYDYGYSVALQPNGKIVVSGISDADFAVARYNDDGSFDTSFGPGGKVITFMGTSFDQCWSVAIQSNGNIVVAGQISGSTAGGINRHNLALAQYDSTGNLDTLFDSDGKVETDFGVPHELQGISVALQSDGKIVVAGFRQYYHWALARYNINGTLDNSFGINGIVVIDSLDGTLSSVAIQSNGKIVVGGYIMNIQSNFALGRFNSNGVFDTSFGSGGIRTTNMGGPSGGTDISIQTDGKIVLTGFVSNGSSNYFGLARYNTDGNLDTAFGMGGKVTTWLGGNDMASSVALQSDQKIVVAGSDNSDFALVRYNTNGTVDNTFGIGGNVTANFGNPTYGAYSVAIQSDGKILAAGSANNFAIVRFNTDGSLDSAFGIAGKVITDFGNNADDAYDLAIQSDGKIVVCGGQEYFDLARYHTDGSLDSSFGTNGKVTSQWAMYANLARSLAIQNDGNIVVAGWLEDAHYYFGVARYNGDGNTVSIQSSSPDQESEILVYPNPSSGAVQIQSSGNVIKSVEMFDVLGEKIFSKQFVSKNLSFKVKARPGIYFLKMICGEKTFTQKLIFQN